MNEMEEIEIVIVGGGICGLATALALHRKGIKSVVLEKSETLRATGAGITIRANGWCALHQLGVASNLRLTSLTVQGGTNISLASGKQQERPFEKGEIRCLRRSELIKGLAENLPPGTIHLGCQVLSITLDPLSPHSIIQLQNGRTIKATVLIGCDGANSVVAGFLGLKTVKFLSLSQVRGFTKYPSGHDFKNEIVQVIGGHSKIGRIPIDNKLVYWFATLKMNPKDVVAKDPELLQQMTLESIKGFPTKMLDMVKHSDQDSLSISRMKYQAPWDILLGSFRKGTVTVAGDAMHAMGPFLGQGGSVALEDAIILARCLARKRHEIDTKTNGSQVIAYKVGEALDQYVKERRMRLVQLSTQTYLTGILIKNPPFLVRFVCNILMRILFSDTTAHSQYDCGRL
ncbi:monooxygenase 1-like [Castanea sativa]|uniref:monooxygenase 1-like n=1 Tax=Castanea sativa TaxID=21020 RepID=UPI003F64BEBC